MLFNFYYSPPVNFDLLNQKKITLSIGKFTLSKFFTVLLFSFFSLIAQAQKTQYTSDLEYYITVLERKIELQSDSMHRLEKNLSTAKVIMLKENLRKKAWIKVVVGETAIVAGAVVGIITGAWIPAAMAVGLIEIYLLVEGRYRLNIKKLKKIRREAKGEKLSNYIK